MENEHILYTDHPGLVQRTPWWIVSSVFHLALVLLAGMWLMTDTEIKSPVEIIPWVPRPHLMPQRVETKRPTTTTDLRDIPKEFYEPDSVITKEDFEDDPFEIQEMEISEGKSSGDPDKPSTIDLKDDGWVTDIGIAGGTAGLFGDRSGPGKRNACRRNGAPPGCTVTVDDSLRWFVRHQNRQNGSWSFSDYHQQCKGVKCERLDLERDYNNWDNCATGLALLCFLGNGHTPRTGPYARHVNKGLSYLVNAQADDGSFSTNNYVHAIAAMAVCEAYGMTRSDLLKGSAQKAVNVIIARQNHYLGWTYGNPASRNDTSVTGWQVMALKAGVSSGLAIENGFDGAKMHFDKITPEVTGESEPVLAEHCAYTYWTDRDDPGHRNATMTAISMLCRLFMGQDSKSRTIRGHINKMLEKLPGNYETADLYGLYYGTYAMCLAGKDAWKQWNKAMATMLMQNQNATETCNDGSWDPTTDFSSQRGGRLFSTAMGCLSLEVYYRYAAVKKTK
ncbi:prenyltransferase/squalene oxidase repeat-containing protein [Planctomycetota bacterium]